MDRAYALSIAGFDPSSGAGVVSDVKTFESFECQGLSVVTALTFQTEDQFNGLKWISEDEIFYQLEPLLDRYPIAAAKIGLVQSLETLNAILRLIRSKQPQIKVIWDPIIKSSTGYEFHRSFKKENLKPILSGFDLITPNREEALFLLESNETYKDLGNIVPTLVKSFSLTDKDIVDRLANGEEIVDFKYGNLHIEKHGSGCVLSSSICAGLAHGLNLVDAIRCGKDYISDFLTSSQSLLGVHQRC